MKTTIIGKESLKDLLKEAVKQQNTYVPQRNLGGDIWLEPLPRKSRKLEEALKNVVLGDEDVLMSPKDIFFPQLESLLEFKADKIKEVTESSPKLLFGIKSCDLKGMLFVDDFFRRNFEDKYYLSRIENRFVVVIGCIKPPRPSCFCTSANTGPFAREGYDLQLVDNRDSYLVEIGSEKGQEFVTKFGKFFRDFSGDASKVISHIKTKTSENIKLKVDFQKALDLMKEDTFVPEEIYKRIGKRCIWCGGCIYVCPTCTCFNVFDNTEGKEGERIRNWDACIFEGYTRETSGHNPRKEKWLRTARRYEHKLKFDYQVTGMSGCIGCGRCLSSCPVNIGMPKFIQEITEGRKLI